MGDDDDDELTGSVPGGNKGGGDAPPEEPAPAPDTIREDMITNAVAFLKHPQV